jgi:hypothetical protein
MVAFRPAVARGRHRLIAPCCMINNVSHDDCLAPMADRSMRYRLAFENIDCVTAILRATKRINQLNTLKRVRSHLARIL